MNELACALALSLPFLSPVENRAVPGEKGCGGMGSRARARPVSRSAGRAWVLGSRRRILLPDMSPREEALRYLNQKSFLDDFVHFWR